jgi:membrane-bound lytic murein transglycosylase MltF
MRWIIVCVLAGVTFGQEESRDLVERTTAPSTADLASMRASGTIRVLVSYSRTNAFFDAGRAKGFQVEMAREYGRFLNRGLTRRDRKVEVVFVPVALTDLLPALVKGRGDIAAAGLTITPERQKLVAFAEPYREGVEEIIVASRRAPRVGTLRDLAGRKVYVPFGSSFQESLARHAAIRAVAPTRRLQTEDLLELAHAGVIPFTVADRHVAELWAPVLTGMEPRPDLKLRTGGKIAWAVRKGNPELLASLNRFMRANKSGTLVGNVLFKRYFKTTRWITNPHDPERKKRLDRVAPIIAKYARQYGFDPNLILAQAYQESGLDPNARSGSGAVGIMQLLPATARDMGFTDLTNPDDNVHAGVKYMAWLRRNYFSDEAIAPAARVDFALAAYNAGPGNVRKWRRLARGRGVDGNVWKSNVEYIALEHVGQQPVVYVGNINKYAVAYALADRIRADRTAR